MRSTRMFLLQKKGPTRFVVRHLLLKYKFNSGAHKCVNRAKCFVH